MDCIDISSSDSDLEIEEDRETDAFVRGSTASTNTRVLPSWASGHSTNLSSKGYDGQSQSQRFPSPKVASASNQSSLNRSNEQANGSIYPAENRNGGQAQTTSFRGSNVHSTDHAKDLASQSSKRTLPHSLQPSTSASNSKHLDGNEGGSQIHNNYGRSYPSGLDIGKRYMAPQFNGATADELIAYENSGYRILPPSLVHGRSVPAQYASSGDAMYHSGIGEEGALGNDERLIYQAALQDLNQPKIEASLPDGLLSISLLRHQKIALAWMLQKETRSLHCLGGILADDQGLGKTISMIALILMQRYLQSKSKSEKISNHKAEAFNLDDDDDGDSKNVVVDNGSAGLCKEEAGESSKPKLIPEASSSTRAFSSKRPAAGTLVVCPASVLRQWARELDEKVAPEGKLSVLVYHGGNRTRDPVELAKYDVIVTTYSIVTNEVPKQPLVDEDDSDEKNGEKYGLSSEFSAGKRKKKTSNAGRKGKKGKKGIDFSSFEYGCGPLARVGWFRVILDEAQTIKNHRTLVARACCSLRAKRRWCLSGTPIQNSIDDLYSYFRFLKYDPYAVYKSFYNTIKVQISRNSIQGYKKLQAVLRAIMLRRTKGTLIDGEPIITLPPKSICLAKVDFSPEERVFYSKLEADSRLQFKEYAAAGTLNQNYANILLLLLRLRQACDHPLLVKGFNTDSVRKESTEMARRLPRDMLVNLLSLLETSSAICCECRDPPEDAVVTMCGHVFCYQCVLDFLTGDENTCPAPKCKEQLGSDVIFSRATLRKCISNDFDSSLVNGGQSNENSIVLQQEYSSSKIKACLEILQSHCDGKKAGSEPFDSRVGVTELTTSGSGLQSEGPVKAIVFSQWTSMLNLVELSLNQSCIQYRRLDGTMSLAARDRAVKDFNNDPEITVMLMSLKAGNLGLNMVAANHVILMDLWWNPTTEDQAIDRAHRIGQNRPVTVSRVTIKNTVEDRILALQEEKRKMVASAFGEDHGGGSATRLTVEDLKYLFMA